MRSTASKSVSKQKSYSFTTTSVLIILFVCSINVMAQEVILFEENFDESFTRWIVTDDPEPISGPSTWSVSNGLLRQTSNIWSYNPPAEFIYHLGSHVSAGDTNWTDYSLNAVIRSSDNDGIGIIFRYQDASNYYRILLMNDAGNSGDANSPIQRIQKFIDGEPRTLLQNKVSEAYPSGYFSLTADVRGDSIHGYLNGELIGAVKDTTYKSGKIGLFVYANSGAVFDDILVTEDKFIYEKPDKEININIPVDQDRFPYIQNPTINSVQIAWRSLIPAVGKVEYGLEKGVYTSSITEPEILQKHHVIIEGLEPDTRYFYRVTNDGKTVLEDYSFKTAKPDNMDDLSFLVLGDSGVNTDIQRQVRDQMLKSHNRENVDFLIHVGDVHQGVGDDYDPIYFDIYTELLSKMNFYLAIGNHDTYTDNAAPFLDDFYTPTNNADSTERYYTYRWANSFFINIDSDLDMSKGSPQYEFIMEALNDERQKSAEWTFAYFHHPPYCEFWPEWDGHQVVRDDLMPLFEEYGVDIVFNGHTHAYEVGELNGVKYVISGGGGGALDVYARDFPHITKSEGVFHYSRVDIEGEKLTFTATDLNGQLVDEFMIDKRNAVHNEAKEENPLDFQLHQNYPNPFNPQTTISFSLEKSDFVTLEIFDSLGKKISTLLNEHKSQGSYSINFDASTLPSGVYLYQLKAGNYQMEKKMTLIK